MENTNKEQSVNDSEVGYTGGIWEVRKYFLFEELEISVGDIRVCVIPYLEPPAEANAQRIVTCVNGYDDLLENNNNLKSESDNLQNNVVPMYRNEAKELKETNNKLVKALDNLVKWGQQDNINYYSAWKEAKELL